MNICDLFRRSKWITIIHIIRHGNVCIIIVALFLSTSCSPTKSSTISVPTEFRPTQTIISTSIQPTATIFSIVTTLKPTINNTTPFPLETKRFQSQEGFFEINYPIDWRIIQDNTSVSFIAPSSKLSLRISSIDTGYQLDSDSFARLVDGRESNIFYEYPLYYEIYREIESQSATVKKQFTLNGEKNIVQSIYKQSKQVIYMLDMWSDQENLEKADEIITSISPTLKVNPSALASHEYETLIDSFIYKTDYFSFNVPTYWKLTRTTTKTSTVDTFRSPDEKAIFQTIRYYDGKLITKSEAGAFTLVLLNNFYTHDITITEDRITIDHREELTWYSSPANIRGVTTFEVRDNHLFIFTIIYNNDYQSIYQPVLEHIMSTYQPLLAEKNP